MAEEVQEVEDQPKSSGKGLVIALLVIVILLLIGIAVLVFMLLGSDIKSANGSESVEQHADVEAVGEAGYSPKYKQFEAPPPNSAPLYFVMDKFVVNFQGDGKARFLAVDLQFMSYYPQVVGEGGEMEHLRPILKNDIQRLLRNQHYTPLSLPDGPDKLRAEILEVARQVLEKHGVYPELLEDVYMTRFVMQ